MANQLLAGRDDRLRVADPIIVTFSGVPNPPLPHKEQVKADGTLNMPLIGSVKAEGRTVGELQKIVYDLYVPMYYNSNSGFTVTVQAEGRAYYIGGEVKAPGPKAYFGDTTVVKAIQAAGDLTDFAKKTRIRLTRADGTAITVNYNRALSNPAFDPPVFPGDTIHVPRRIL
jgi:polysaccharide export outer membrane protein